MITVYAYGIFNETIKDRAYYKQVYEKKGYKEIERPKEVVHSTMNRFFMKNL